MHIYKGSFDNLEELVLVLSHEISHVILRHGNAKISENATF
jgi:predicted Zn-dependent protease